MAVKIYLCYQIPIKNYDEYSKIFNKKYRKRKIYRFINDLRRAGYLKTKNFRNYIAFIWTFKGTNKLLKTNIKIYGQSAKSNKNWLMVIYDIPENRHKDRNQFRKMLKLLGYQQLQKVFRFLL